MKINERHYIIAADENMEYMQKVALERNKHFLHSVVSTFSLCVAFNSQ